MNYKTILVLVDESRHASERVRHAAGLAVRFNAHLVGSAFTGKSTCQSTVAVLERIVLPPEEIASRSRHAAALDCFDASAASEGVLSIERRLREHHHDSLAQQARCADLAILSQTPLCQYNLRHLPN